MKIKYWFVLAIALVVVAALLLSACGTPATTTVTSTTATTATTTATATTTTTATTTVTPITLKFSYDMPLKVSVAQAWHIWADEVTKETNGQVKFDFYPGGTLFDIFSALDSVKARVADIACMSEAINMNRFQLFGITQYPGLGFGNSKEQILALGQGYDKLIAKFPEVASEFKDWKLLFHTGGNGSVIVSNVPINTPADLKGRKIGDTGVVTQLIKDLGAAPVQLGPPDYYMNLKTGVVDVVLSDWAEIYSFKLWEPAKYFYEYGIGGQATLSVIMNWDSWNAIPADSQAVMTKLAANEIQDTAKILVDEGSMGKQSSKDAGRTISAPTADEITAWDKVMEPMWLAWVDEQKAKGVTDAADILSYWRSLQAEAR